MRNEPPKIVDFGQMPIHEVSPGTLDGFVIASSALPDGAALLRVVESLRPGGVGRVVIDQPDRLPALIDSSVGVAWVGAEIKGRALELHVGAQVDGRSVDPRLALAEVAARLAGEAAEARDALAEAEAKIRQDARRHEAALAKVKTSTQFRIGDAMVGVVRRPHRAPALVAEFRDIWRARSHPNKVPLPAPDETPRLDLSVASVLDDFSHHCLRPEVALSPLERKGWEQTVADADLVLMESAWRGNGERWSYALNQFETRGEDVRQVLQAARLAGVPSVFWNKEDPVSFDVFLPAAAEFDAVVTTDADMVPRYCEALGHGRVAALPFAAQPRIHNPIGRPRGGDVQQRVCFAGSWRGDKYIGRGGDLEALLRPPLDRGVLDIYDRFAGHPEEDTLGFPAPFRAAVAGSLGYQDMLVAYRNYAAFLNVNSVRDSPTMFSRRVFELLACATPVISTPARGIEEMLGGLVLTSDSPTRTDSLIEWVTEEPDARDRHAHLGYRTVHRDHTYRQRVDSILTLVERETERPRRLVSVICVSNRPEQIDHVVDSYTRQTYGDTELIFVANANAFTSGQLSSVEQRVPRSTVLQIDESATLGECLNQARAVATGRYFAKFDDDDLYGDEYLADLMLAFEYTDAAVVGKQCYFAHLEGRNETLLRFKGREFREAPRVVGGTIVADEAQVGSIAFESLPRGTDTRFLTSVRDRGLAVFSADRFNFCQVRRADPRSHTWGIDDDEFARSAVFVGRGLVRDEIFL